MAQLTPSQLRWRGRIESGLRVAAPILDLVLAAGDRVSRLRRRDDPELLLAADDHRLTDGRD